MSVGVKKVSETEVNFYIKKNINADHEINNNIQKKAAKILLSTFLLCL